MKPKPKPKLPSRVEKPWQSMDPDERDQLRQRQLKQELNEHQLTRYGRLFGCTCGCCYFNAGANQREAEYSHGRHVAIVKDNLSGRTTPEWME